MIVGVLHGQIQPAGAPVIIHLTLCDQAEESVFPVPNGGTAVNGFANGGFEVREGRGKYGATADRVLEELERETDVPREGRRAVGKHQAGRVPEVGRHVFKGLFTQEMTVGQAEEIVGQIGTSEILPDPEGDVALSPDGKWFVNGAREGPHNVYTIVRRSDGSHIRQSGFPHLGFTRGDLRLDPAPSWNRTNDAVLVPAFASDKTRQLFLIRIRPAP